MINSLHVIACYLAVELTGSVTPVVYAHFDSP